MPLASMRLTFGAVELGQVEEELVVLGARRSRTGGWAPC